MLIFRETVDFITKDNKVLKWADAIFLRPFFNTGTTCLVDCVFKSWDKFIGNTSYTIDLNFKDKDLVNNLHLLVIEKIRESYPNIVINIVI